MKKYRTLLAVIVSALFVILLSACSNTPKIDEIKLSDAILNMQVGDYKFVGYTIYPTSVTGVDLEWTSSDENIATVVGSKYNEYIGTAKITAKSYGTCTIIVKAGDKTNSLTINVGIDPNILITQQKNNIFDISSNLPAGTKLNISLSGENYSNIQEVILENGKLNKTTATVLFSDTEKELNGNYLLKITLCDISMQNEEIKSKLGANYENLVGDNIEIVNDIKTLRFENTYELPFKTELEKIQETDYRSLTKSQMLTVIYWIEERYEYYDKIYGKYSGDRYTETIFSEAAERYNKTKSEIRWIWNKSYELKYQ